MQSFNSNPIYLIEKEKKKYSYIALEKTNEVNKMEKKKASQSATKGEFRPVIGQREGGGGR